MFGITRTTRFGMILNRSDIVQIPFPFSNLEPSKLRPVLLLTGLDTLGDFLAVAITSQPGHHDAISLKNDDLINGLLPKQSWIRGTKHFSLNQEVAVANLGSLKITSFERIHSEICYRWGECSVRYYISVLTLGCPSSWKLLCCNIEGINAT